MRPLKRDLGFFSPTLCTAHAKHLHLTDICYLSTTLSFKCPGYRKNPSTICWHVTSLVIATTMTNLRSPPRVRCWTTCGMRRLRASLVRCCCTVSERPPVPGEHMESITARCSRCLMKSMFVFRQRYILLGPLPMGLLQTHMGVICPHFSAGKEIRRGENGLGILGLESSLRGLASVGEHVFGATENGGFCDKRLLNSFT